MSSMRFEKAGACRQDVGVTAAFRSGLLFALVDCNNFYVSCERAFDPTLCGRPVVVLSNNDGCIVSRSNEAKALGIPMGVPFHEWQSFILRNKVQVRSSNYALYGDMSHRIMRVLSQNVPQVEVYSIDEAFLSLAAFSQNAIPEIARELREQVLRWTGIPVSIGIGPSKTLAKVSNKLAKMGAGTEGILNWREDIQRETLLGDLDIEAIWGVGRRIGKTLKSMGVHTALDLKRMDPDRIRRRFNVSLMRTVLELRGIPCYPLGEGLAPKQSIVCSRTFGGPVTAYAALREAVATYTTVAAEKLRNDHSLARTVHVFLMTNPFQQHQEQYANSAIRTLPVPTAYTPDLLRAALDGLAEVYRPGYQYKRTGVMLAEIVRDSPVQMDLFAADPSKFKRLMKTMDRINREWGRDTLHFAASGITRDWKMHQKHLSPRYTTHWDELPIAYA